MPDRRRRIAENEVRFREINERMRESLAGVIPGDELLPFVCECGNGACTAPVSLTLAEYDAVRADARHFAVLAGHEIPDVETVVETSERFTVVEKQGPTVAIAEARDPRR